MEQAGRGIRSRLGLWDSNGDVRVHGPGICDLLLPCFPSCAPLPRLTNFILHTASWCSNGPIPAGRGHGMNASPGRDGWSNVGEKNGEPVKKRTDSWDQKLFKMCQNIACSWESCCIRTRMDGLFCLLVGGGPGPNPRVSRILPSPIPRTRLQSGRDLSSRLWEVFVRMW
jgi:hypothetical protein